MTCPTQLDPRMVLGICSWPQTMQAPYKQKLPRRALICYESFCLATRTPTTNTICNWVVPTELLCQCKHWI